MAKVGFNYPIAAPGAVAHVLTALAFLALVSGFSPPASIRAILPGLRGFRGGCVTSLHKRPSNTRHARLATKMQQDDANLLTDFGDSPNDVLKWTREREAAKSDATAEIITRRYGEWQSPITSKLVTSGAVPLSSPRIDGDDLYWLERRPAEGGRQVVMRQAADGAVAQVTPAAAAAGRGTAAAASAASAWNVRTRVHEYGGGDYLVHQGVLYFANFNDQRLYGQLAALPGADPFPLTPPGPRRYADMSIDAPRSRLICVMEEHAAAGGEPANSLVAVSLDDDSAECPEPVVLARGRDFYAAPRVSPDGRRLAWLEWDHPNMPWDATRLLVADLLDPAAGGGLGPARVVAGGGGGESVTQPVWGPGGELYFISDRSNWWNIYVYTEPAGGGAAGGGAVRCVRAAAAEFAGPMWTLGGASYGVAAGGAALYALYKDPARAGIRLGRIDTATGDVTDLEAPYTHYAGLALSESRLAVLAGAPSRPTELVAVPLRPTGAGAATPPKPPGARDWRTVAKSSTVEFDQLYISAPQAIEFPTAGGAATAHLLYYPPRSGRYAAPAGELPPLLVKSHGGPTAAAAAGFDPGIQFWTSRGYAVADVDYRGSSGYGRTYRDALRGQWGVADVEDVCAAAAALAARGLVDGGRVFVDGASAGGLTTLGCLAFGPAGAFRGGASLYGVSDLEALAQETHKFESRYMDSLIGPLPAAAEEYRRRSPINAIDKLNCPIIFFHGTEDKVVPPNQAERMHAAVKGKGLPTALVIFEGEQHGFRRTDSIRRCLDGELFFFNSVLGLDATMPKDLDIFDIDNLDPLDPLEDRSYVVIDGFELEIGRETQKIRQVGYVDVGDAAYFPEERPDRPSGSWYDPDKVGSDKLEVEWK